MTSGRGLGRSVAGMVCAVGLVVASTSVSVGTTETKSSPSGALTVTSGLTSVSDRDHDQNADTAKAGDTVNAASSVTNNTAEVQAVTVTYTLDAPGTAYDTSETEQVAIAAGQTSTRSESYHVTGRFPAGTYEVTTTAVGIERASATGSIVVH